MSNVLGGSQLPRLGVKGKLPGSIKPCVYSYSTPNQSHIASCSELFLATT